MARSALHVIERECAWVPLSFLSVGLRRELEAGDAGEAERLRLLSFLAVRAERVLASRRCTARITVDARGLLGQSIELVLDPGRPRAWADAARELRQAEPPRPAEARQAEALRAYLAAAARRSEPSYRAALALRRVLVSVGETGAAGAGPSPGDVVLGCVGPDPAARRRALALGEALVAPWAHGQGAAPARWPAPVPVARWATWALPVVAIAAGARMDGLPLEARRRLCTRIALQAAASEGPLARALRAKVGAYSTQVLCSPEGRFWMVFTAVPPRRAQAALEALLQGLRAGRAPRATPAFQPFDDPCARLRQQIEAAWADALERRLAAVDAGLPQAAPSVLVVAPPSVSPVRAPALGAARWAPLPFDV